MTTTPTPQDTWISEFKKLCYGVLLGIDKECSDANKIGIKSFIAFQIEKAKVEERERCKQVYIDYADWAEWGMDDKEAGEAFDEGYQELYPFTPRQEEEK